MDTTGLTDRISALTADNSATVQDRISAVMTLREEIKPDDETEQQELDAVCYKALSDMVAAENGDHACDIEMFQLYTLLIETYRRLNRFRPMKEIITGTVRLIDDCDVSFLVIEQAVPRILYAAKASVYNHDRYRLLAAYIRAAGRAMADDEYVDNDTVVSCIRTFLNLYGLLDPSTRPDLLDADMQIIIGWFLPHDEFCNIIDHPKDDGLLLKDPVEYTLRWEEVYYDVVEELDRRFAGEPRYMGFCFRYWPEMANLLWEKYGIRWQDPHLMNPGVMFD